MALYSHIFHLFTLMLVYMAVTGTTGFPTLAQNDTCVAEGFSCSIDCETVYQCLGSGPFSQIVREACDSTKGYFCSANIGKCVSTFASTCAPPGYSFTCTSVGTFPDPYDCAGYHICYGDNNNLQHSPEECESGWLYDPDSTVCEIQASYCTEDPVPACQNANQIGALSKNPSIYYVCTQNNPDGPLYPILYECPHGQSFDYSILSCTNDEVSTVTPPVTTVPPTPTEYTSVSQMEYTTGPPTATESDSGTQTGYITGSPTATEGDSGTQTEYTTGQPTVTDGNSGTQTEYTTGQPTATDDNSGTQTEYITGSPTATEGNSATQTEYTTEPPTQAEDTTSEKTSAEDVTTLSPTTVPIETTTEPPAPTTVQSTTSSSGYSCTEAGRFLDPEDCFSYYECSVDLLATHYTCGFGTYFSDILDECVFGFICIE